MSARLCTWLWVAAGALTPSGEPPREREVTYESHGVELAATLMLPDAPGRSPAVVILHGSGDSDRSNPWTSAYAKALVSRGIAVLHPDKRGCGKSGGDWKTVGFEALADDAARGVELLRKQPEVDAAWVGLVGFSQGVHVAPVCAERQGAADFVVSVSGSVVPLLEQVVDEIAMESARKGRPLSADERKSVTALYAGALQFAKSGKGWDELRAEISSASAGSPAIADAVRGLPPDPGIWVWKWMAAVGEFDPLPRWKRVEAPMLFLYGGRDERVDVGKSIALLQKTFGGGEKNWSVIELGPNGHALFREDALDFVARWVRDRAAR